MWAIGRLGFVALLTALATLGQGTGGSGVLSTGAALAQATPDGRESGIETIRRRQRDEARQDGLSTAPYWQHFELMNKGDCAAAMPGLRVYAQRGRGYENAQHALGLCLLETGQEGEARTWIARAAEAGLAAAQATQVRLFVLGGPAVITPEDAAMWLYLYETNPLRLLMGTEYALAPDDAQAARARIPRAAYLAGVERARSWTPQFPEASTDARATAR